MARDALVGMGMEVFCPFESVKRRRNLSRGRSKLETVELPVFSPYLFVRTDSYLAAQRARGVHSLVKSRGLPLVVPDAVMKMIVAATDPTGRTDKSPRNKSFWFKPKVGENVNVIDGPFNGFMAEVKSLARLDETGAISAWVTIFGRPTSVDLPYTWVAEAA